MLQRNISLNATAIYLARRSPGRAAISGLIPGRASQFLLRSMPLRRFRSVSEFSSLSFLFELGFRAAACGNGLASPSARPERRHEGVDR